MELNKETQIIVKMNLNEAEALWIHLMKPANIPVKSVSDLMKELANALEGE